MKSVLVLSILMVSVLSDPQRFNGRRNLNGRRGGASCRGGNKPNHSFGGTQYLVSWKIGCVGFGQSQAVNFCRQNGMKPISLDTPAKEKEFISLVQRDGQKYFWTGGKVNHGRNRRKPWEGASITWPSGKTTTTSQWSPTGRNKNPQPDNRDKPETCVAVLNNFYNDGTKFHDVKCGHKKPIICEP